MIVSLGMSFMSQFLFYRISGTLFGLVFFFGSGSLFFGLGFFIFGVIMTFLYSAFIHVIMIAFKSEGSYKDSYNVYTYSMVPYLILSVIPIIGFLSIIYSFVLMIMGISRVHNVSKGKAALACLLPLVLVFGLIIGFIIMLYIRFFGILS